MAGATASEVTARDARRHLKLLGELLGAGDFPQVVLLVTVDHVFWSSSARYEKYGPYHLVWTEHHGTFMVHEDEVAKVHVIRVQGPETIGAG